MAKKPYIVGITGGSGSGKTFYLNSLLKELGENICVISQDNYYYHREQQSNDINGIKNFDTPESIDLDAFEMDLKRLSEGQEVSRQEYIFNKTSITPRMAIYRPSQVIIVEGIFLFYKPEIASLIDLKIFLDVKEEIKFQRRLKRDVEERGYDQKDIIYRFENHVIPNFEKNIKPFRSEMDLIIPNNRNIITGLEILCAFLKEKLRQE